MKNEHHNDKRVAARATAQFTAARESAMVTAQLATWREELEAERAEPLTAYIASLDLLEWDEHMALFRGATAYTYMAHGRTGVTMGLPKKVADVGVTIFGEPRPIKITHVRVNALGRKAVRITYRYLVH